MHDIAEARLCLRVPSCSRAFKHILSNFLTRGKLGAGGPWAEDPAAPQSKAILFDNVTSLSRISARFAARLVHAGALPALLHLEAKQLEHCGEAAGQGPGASADSLTRQVVKEAFERCIAAFARSVPQVSHQEALQLDVHTVAVCAC